MSQKRWVETAVFCLGVLFVVALPLHLWRDTLSTGFIREDSWLYSTAPPSLYDIVCSFFFRLDELWYHRPTRMWVFSFSTFLFGVRPEPLHVVSWGCLFGSMFFFYRILRGWFSSPLLILACLGAFALSSVQGKTLYWPAALHNHLALFFAAGALYFRLRDNARVLSLLFFTLAMYSRESMMGWIVPLIAADYFRIPEGERSFNRLARASADLALAVLFVLATYYTSGTFSASEMGRRLQIGPWATLQALASYIVAVIGWTDGEWSHYWQLDFDGWQLAIVAFTLSFWAYLAWRAIRYRAAIEAQLLAMAVGGVAFLLLHQDNWEVEYAVVFAAALAAQLCYLAHQLVKSKPGLVPVVAALILGGGYLNGYSTAHVLARVYVSEARVCDEMVQSFQALKLPPGSVVLVEDANPVVDSRNYSGCLVHLPRALAASVPGVLVAFANGLTEKGVHFVATVQALHFRDTWGEFTPQRVRLEGTNWQLIR